MKGLLPLASTLLTATMLTAVPALADTLDIHAPQIVIQNQKHTSPSEEVQTETPTDTTRDLTTEAPGENASEPVENEAQDNNSSVDIVSGGIGDDELAHMKSIQNQYDLKLLITEKNGTFISDVAVHIEDMKGHVLADVTAEGPILLANLPTGKYKVRAQRGDDEVKDAKISVVKGKLRAYMFSFKNTDERDSGDPRTTPLK
ncbi:MAG TPA: hypothetical protein VFT64_02740 [Rickettsiales bacterium]|nr:hypothetical protein [Rickettsiales bacterium]